VTKMQRVGTGVILSEKVLGLFFVGKYWICF
jgi:hypothetical protein